MAQYFSLNSWLLWPTVYRSGAASLLDFGEVLFLGLGDEIDRVLPSVRRRRQRLVIRDIVLLLEIGDK